MCLVLPVAGKILLTRFCIARTLFPMPEFLHHDMACTPAEMFQPVHGCKNSVVKISIGRGFLQKRVGHDQQIKEVRGGMWTSAG